MEIQINSKKIPAKFDKKSGRYYATFIAENTNYVSIKNSLDCIGDTQLQDIQLELGDIPTSYTPPKITITEESGLYRLVKELRNSTEQKITEVGETVTNATSNFNQRYDEIVQNVNVVKRDYLAKNEIQITENGILLGSGKIVNGTKLASLLSITPNAMELITKQFKIKGDMLVDGTIESKHIKSKTIEAGHIKTGSITSELLSSDSIQAKHLKVDDGVIEKLFTKALHVETLNSKRAVTNLLKAVKIDVNQLVASYGHITNLEAVKGFIRDLESVGIKAKYIEANTLESYLGRIGGFQLGRHSGDGYTRNWLTGTTNFNVGIADGQGRRNQAAIWANWGSNWDSPGSEAWYVRNDGVMYANAGMTVTGNSDFYGGVNLRGTTTFSSYALFQVEAVFGKGLNTGSYDVYGDGTNPRGGRNRVVWWSQQSSFLSYSSDRRLKENIHPTTVKALSTIKKLNMVQFDWKKDSKHEEIGMVAQELQKILPSVIHEEDGMLSIKYIELIPYLIKGMQELLERIEAIESSRN